MTASPVFDLPPARAAARVIAAHRRDPEWLDQFSAALDRQRKSRALERILDVWGLSQSEAGRRFGVSRQAVAKWVRDGVPAERVQDIANLSAATDVLVHYLQRDRIPAVVRRPVGAFDGGSLLDMVGEGRFRDVLDACRSMFDYSQTQR